MLSWWQHSTNNTKVVGSIPVWVSHVFLHTCLGANDLSQQAIGHNSLLHRTYRRKNFSSENTSRANTVIICATSHMSLSSEFSVIGGKSFLLLLAVRQFVASKITVLHASNVWFLYKNSHCRLGIKWWIVEILYKIQINQSHVVFNKLLY